MSYPATLAMPAIAAKSSHARVSLSLETSLIYLPLIASSVLAKIAMPPFAAQGIGVAIPLLLVSPIVAKILGARVRLEPHRFVLYCVSASALGITQTVLSTPYSLASLFLLLAVHLPYIWQVDTASSVRDRALELLANIATVSALFGLAQFLLQGRVSTPLLFPIENFTPGFLLAGGFNQQGQLAYGIDLYRANGAFFLEPSYFGQFLAVAAVAELCTKQRMWRLSLYALALIVSYSGTGLLVLALCAPPLLIRQGRWGFLPLAVCGAALLALAPPAMHLDRLVGRIGEFGSSGSSGFSRFVGGFYLLDQFVWQEPLHTLFGNGAGTFRTIAPQGAYTSAEMPLFKMLFEFGICGASLYFVFLSYCVFANPAPRALQCAIGITFLLNGLYTPFSHGLALTLLLWPAAANSIESKNAHCAVGRGTSDVGAD